MLSGFGGGFFEQMQDDPRIGVKIGMCQCYDFGRRINHVRIVHQ